MIALTFSPDCRLAASGAPITCSKHEGIGLGRYDVFNGSGKAGWIVVYTGFIPNHWEAKATKLNQHQP
jgi:hypothetical protein